MNKDLELDTLSIQDHDLVIRLDRKLSWRDSIQEHQNNL